MGIKNIIGDLQVNSSPVITESLIENTEVTKVEALENGSATATAVWNKDKGAFQFTFGLPKGNTGPQGGKGDNGQTVQLRKTTSYIQWKYADEVDTAWRNLIALTDITGDAGDSGKSVELQKTSTHIQWRQTGGNWTNLVALSDIKGTNGTSITITSIDQKNGAGETSTVTFSNGSTLSIKNGLNGGKGDKGDDGSDGKSVELQKTASYIQWKQTGGNWTNLVALSELKGQDGGKGDPGNDGKSVELKKSSSHIQWKQTDGDWTNLVALSDLKGQDGGKGDPGNDGKDGKQVQLQKGSSAIQWKYDTDSNWTNLVNLSDLKGDPGSDATVTKAAVEGVLTGNITSHTHSGYLPKVTYEWNNQVTCGSGDSGAISFGRYNIYDTQITFDIVSTTTKAISGKLVIATQNGVIQQAVVYGDASGQLASRLRIYQSAISNKRSWIEIFGMFDGWSKNKAHIYAIGLESGTVDKQYTKVTQTGSTTKEPVEITSGDTKWTGTITDAIQAQLPSTTKQTNWDTAYGWGNHASVGYTKNTGTVTSVGMTVPTGLTVNDSPITTSGTLAVTFASGYSIPTTAKQSNWDTAYGWGDHSTKGYLTTHQSLANYVTLDGAGQEITGKKVFGNVASERVEVDKTQVRLANGSSGVNLQYDSGKKALKFVFT